MQCTSRRVQCKTISGLQYKTLCLGQSYTSPRTINTWKRNLELNSEFSIKFRTYFHPQNLESKRNNPWFKPWFNILLQLQFIVVDAKQWGFVFRVLGIYTFCLGAFNFECFWMQNTPRTLYVYPAPYSLPAADVLSIS